jgi:hypothetical protein
MLDTTGEVDPDDLYGLPLDRFVLERAALAKTLRKDGQRDEAARVVALRKPSVAAWAVNQLVRTQGRAVAELFEAGDVAQEAQADLLAGRADGSALRDSMARERAAVAELVHKARGLLSSEGHELTPAMLERVSETLHAAALNEEARAQVRDGRLGKELRHIGLGPGAQGPKGGRTARSKAAPAPTRRTDKREQAEGVRAAQKAQTEARRAAHKAEADARHAAERAARQLAGAQKARDRIARSLGEAEDALAVAAERAEQAEREHQHAREALERP